MSLPEFCKARLESSIKAAPPSKHVPLLLRKVFVDGGDFTNNGNLVKAKISHQKLFLKSRKEGRREGRKKGRKEDTGESRISASVSFQGR
jgi:hypothetical protein